MTYKIFELIDLGSVDDYAYCLKDLNEVFEDEYWAIERIKYLKEHSFSDYTILKIY